MANDNKQVNDILNYVDSACIRLDLAWNITYANPQCSVLLGPTAEELIGTDLRETLPDVISMFYKTLSRALTKHEQQNANAYYGPTEKHLELFVVYYADGILAVFRDITTEKRNEQLIKDAAARYRTVLETMGDGLILINNKGIITDFNAAAEKIFGYPSKEVIGRDVSILLPEKERHEHANYIAHSNIYESRIINRSRNLEGVRKDGSIFPLELNVSPMYVNGEHGFIGILRDTSERKQAEAEILTAKEKAERASHAKTEFIHSMSHELHTPLNAIIGFSQLLEMDESMDPLQKEEVVFIRQAGERLLDMVEDVLDLAKIEAGKMVTTAENFSLRELLDECHTLIKPLADKSGIRLDLKQHSQISTVRADRRRLKQVLLNLLANAVKYNQEGGEVTLISNDHNDEGLRITVSDDGSGLDDAQLSSLFEPFNRLGREGTNIGGTGIGLVISKQLTELMGGTLGVKSIPGEGSSFWVDLPLALEESP